MNMSNSGKRYRIVPPRMIAVALNPSFFFLFREEAFFSLFFAVPWLETGIEGWFFRVLFVSFPFGR